MLLAAELREALGVPGLSVEQTLPFRDKERMKQVLDAAGIRTPRHLPRDHDGRLLGSRRAHRLSADPQADRRRGLGGHVPRAMTPTSSRDALPRLAARAEVSVEEFIDGEEFTFDTVYDRRQHRLLQHRLVPAAAAASRARNEWISPQVIALRDVDRADARGRRAHGPRGAPRARVPVPASRTWSGTARPTAKSCSARSARARRARTRSIR